MYYYINKFAFTLPVLAAKTQSATKPLQNFNIQSEEYYKDLIDSIIADEGVGLPNKEWYVYNDLSSGKPTVASGISMIANKQWLIDNLGESLYNKILSGAAKFPEALNKKFITYKLNQRAKKLFKTFNYEDFKKLNNAQKIAILNTSYNAENYSPLTWKEHFKALKNNDLYKAAYELVKNSTAMKYRGSFERFQRNAARILPGYVHPVKFEFKYKDVNQNYLHNKQLTKEYEDKLNAKTNNNLNIKTIPHGNNNK